MGHKNNKLRCRTRQLLMLIILMLTAALAPDGFSADLSEELKRHGVDKPVQYASLFLFEIAAESEIKSLVWAEDLWPNCQLVKIESIGDAAKKLKEKQRNWVAHSFQLHRRTALIQEKLPKFTVGAIDFPSSYEPKPFGVFSLLSETEMLICEKPQQKFPLGQWQFVEDKKSPSRAYLKLWETFTRNNFKPSGTCIDMGSSPGGWTQVLSGFASNVWSVDKADLDPNVSSLKNVEVLKKDAFKLDPEEIGQVDWFFSDVICTPDRLFELVEKWRPFVSKGFVCTIKFKGKTDFDALEMFQNVSGSTTMHLHNNKHEVTWLLKF
jgi:23S rRNA (cytidine2498-2'-O)-methyltransferase